MSIHPYAHQTNDYFTWLVENPNTEDKYLFSATAKNRNVQYFGLVCFGKVYTDMSGGVFVIID